MKKISIIISFVLLIGSIAIFTGCGQTTCEYEGVWMFAEMYEDGELFSDEAGGFLLTIDENGHWTIADDANHDNGDLTTLEGKDCLYYDEYVYYPSIEEGNLVLNAEPREDGQLTDLKGIELKIVLKKID